MDLKKLTANDIECLLGVRKSDQHILELLGYGYSTEGQKRFRAERPDTYQQISEHLAAVLEKNGLFPASIDPHNPGSATFIQRMGSLYKISSLEEIGIGKEKRFEGEFMTLGDAIRAYVRRCANPDYIRVDQQQA